MNFQQPDLLEFATSERHTVTGTEWIVEAYGCLSDRLSDLATLQGLFARMMRDLDLHACGDGRWHQFPTSGGITGITVLTESHLACHSFPEYGTLCLNLFCCRPRPEWDFAGQLHAILGAQTVNVRRLDRPYAQSTDSRSSHAALQVSHADD
jgi:S-adenosylmethionine decarboxylase